ncbi:MAG: hypothetical protein L0H79_12010 [Intrasporangium sp.]|nr:hypothetical protein [Intrasporangium sp.]MDN5796462.1 hypothetical protein [Intrasporangium sp.]
MLRGEVTGLPLVVEAADRLRRVGEGWVALIHNGVRQHRDDLLWQTGRGPRALQRRAEDVAQAALRVGDTHVQCQLGQLWCALGDEVGAAQDVADLGSVAVGQHHPPSPFHQPDDLLGESLCCLELLGDSCGPATGKQNVASDCDDSGLSSVRHLPTLEDGAESRTLQVIPVRAQVKPA